MDLPRLDAPIVQAGMGGGISRHELAAAVSEAGGLGTIGTLAPGLLAEEIAAARRLTGTPIAVNLLLPFVTPAHREAARGADVVVTFWGPPRRPTGGCWLHQCGSPAEARAAIDAGADGVIAQGVEAGGHVRGSEPALDLLERCLAAVGPGLPVLAAGGLADAGDVARALGAGARAAVLGTRFLLSEESRAHPAYKRRLLDAEETVLTELFGLGWPRAPHRVVANAATRRWLGDDPAGSRAVRALNALTAPLASRLQGPLQARMGALQSARLPLLSPLPALDDGPAGLVEAGPLYAGQSVARIGDLRPAAGIVRDLAP